MVVGVDTVDVRRIARAVDRLGDAFLRRVFTERELAACGGRVKRLAQLYAAKEAVSKALGVGLAEAGGRVGAKEIELLDQEGRSLAVNLLGEARVNAAQMGLAQWHVSTAVAEDMAIAYVLGSDSTAAAQNPFKPE